MLTSKKTLLLRILFIFSLLNIPQYNYPTFPEDFSLNAYQPYIIACVTSCCLGVLLCAFFQHRNKPTLVPKEKSQPKEESVHPIEIIITEAEKRKKDQKELVDLINQQTSKIGELQNQVKILKQKSEKFMEFSMMLCMKNRYAPVAGTLLWLEHCKEKAIEMENDVKPLYEKPLSIAQT